MQWHQSAECQGVQMDVAPGLNLKIRIDMMSSQPVLREFSQEQKELIEQILSKQPYPDSPNEIELCTMVQHLQRGLSSDPTSIDLALYLRRRAEKKTREKVVVPILSEGLQKKSSSMFRQFADPQPKLEQPPKTKRKDSSKEGGARSKRKVRPTQPLSGFKTLEELVQFYDNNTNECHIIFERKSRKSLQPRDQTGSLHESCQWLYNEHFYSSLDRPFFKDDQPVIRVFEALELTPEKMTYQEHRVLRAALPKPRLFDADFIGEEADQLREYRLQVRLAPKQQRSREGDFSVGREVMALHPACGHLHQGNILAIYKENYYMVKFTRPELGTQKVLDINMVAKQLANPHQIVTENVNFEVMALTIKLLEYKSQLIKALKEYNVAAQDVGIGRLDNKFFQQYGWIGSTINILSLGIRHIMSRFRTRGLDQVQDSEKMGKNFGEILINPLGAMCKDLEKSSDQSDVKASSQIKRIISNYKENRTDQIAKQLFVRYYSRLPENDWSPQQRKDMETMLQGLVGLLVNLKVEPKNLNIEENRYLNELMDEFDSRFSEHFNEIFEVMTSITSRIAQGAK